MQFGDIPEPGFGMARVPVRASLPETRRTTRTLPGKTLRIRCQAFLTIQR